MPHVVKPGFVVKAVTAVEDIIGVVAGDAVGVAVLLEGEVGREERASAVRVVHVAFDDVAVCIHQRRHVHVGIVEVAQALLQTGIGYAQVAGRGAVARTVPVPNHRRINVLLEPNVVPAGWHTARLLPTREDKPARKRLIPSRGASSLLKVQLNRRD